MPSNSAATWECMWRPALCIRLSRAEIRWSDVTLHRVYGGREGKRVAEQLFNQLVNEKETTLLSEKQTCFFAPTYYFVFFLRYVLKMLRMHEL